MLIKNLDGPIRKLVQLRPSRDLLAIPQQGLVVLFTQKDALSCREYDLYLHWRYYGMFFSPFGQYDANRSVWSWFILLWQSYP